MVTALVPATAVPALPCRGGCGQQLTDADSRRVGYGPDCAARRGIPHPRHQTTARPLRAVQGGPDLLDLIGDPMTEQNVPVRPAESPADASSPLDAPPGSPERSSGDLSGPYAALPDAVVGLGALSLAFARVNRITYHPDGTTPESDTDHTVMLGLIACALADRWYPALNKGQIAQYALVHDLVEVYAGDMPTLRALSADAKAEKRAREHAAYQRIQREFTQLPWLAWTISCYEDLATPEARFVKALDKLLPKITHLLNGAATIRAQGVTRDELAARYEQQIDEIYAYAEGFNELFDLRAALVGMVLDLIDSEVPA